MRRRGVPPWEVAALHGHSVGKDYAITERYAFYSPDYPSKAVEVRDALIRRSRTGRLQASRTKKVSKAAVAQG